MLDADDLHSFDPRFRPYLKCLLMKENLSGFGNEFVRITSASSGYDEPFSNGKQFDRCKLIIPCAQQSLTWEVIFDVCNPKEPPDIIFEEQDDDFYPALELLNSYVCWDWKNQESLSALISELLQFYREYQLQRAYQNLTLQRHVRSLLGMEAKNYEIIINKGEKNLGSTNVTVEIDVDLSALPPSLTQGNPGPASAHLHMLIPYPECSSTRTQLYLSPSVEGAFGGAPNLRIPPCQMGMLLGEYILVVQQLLKKQVKIIKDSYEKKKELISAFLNCFRKSVIEFDVQDFDKISLLLEWNDFFFTFTVELPLYFPSEHPIYIFKSVYHCENKRPYTERHTDFPYSPRWSADEMAKRASAYILDSIRAFQLSSVNNGDK